MSTSPWIAPDLQALLDQCSDEQITAATLYGEARSEPIEGIVAVGCVIRHRVDTDLGDDHKPDWWGETYRGVCLAPFQFSCWNTVGGRRNLDRVRTLVEQFARKEKITDAAARECAFVAHGIIGGWLRDSVKGANHYHTATLQPRPKWAQNHVPLVQRASHVFYRL